MQENFYTKYKNVFHVKPDKCFARIENFTPFESIPEKGFITELNSLEYVSEIRWLEQFVIVSPKKTYVLYAQLVFSDIPFGLTHKIKFMYADVDSEDFHSLFTEVRKLIWSQTYVKMEINKLDYENSLTSHNLFYRGTIVLENQGNP